MIKLVCLILEKQNISHRVVKTFRLVNSILLFAVMLEQGTCIPQSGCPLATCETFEALLNEMLPRAVIE